VSPYAPTKAPLLRGRKTSALHLDVQNARDEVVKSRQEFKVFDGM
jgi:hypothetical protein